MHIYLYMYTRELVHEPVKDGPEKNASICELINQYQLCLCVCVWEDVFARGRGQF